MADTLNAAAGAAKMKVGLLDSTKFKRSSLLTVRSAQSLDMIITDDGLDSATVAEFRAAGVNLQVATGAADVNDPEAARSGVVERRADPGRAGSPLAPGGALSVG